jgi:hypothetical protein
MTDTIRLGLKLINPDEPVDIKPISNNIQLIDDKVRLKIKVINFSVLISKICNKTDLESVTSKSIGF